MKKYIVVIVILSLALISYKAYDYFFSKKYFNVDFDIENYVSDTDYDLDGIDDQSDILLSVKEYLSTSPIYKSVYYETGYSTDNYGVCTDVVAFGLLGAGYDLMTLVNDDILENPSNYDIEEVDINIDFRRVSNLLVYFESAAISLTTDIEDVSAWQGGDIVVFEEHIAVVSDARDENGIVYILHHSGPYQILYEELITIVDQEIVGHFRIS